MAGSNGLGEVWSEKETNAFLQTWSKENIKRQLSSTHRNAKVFLCFSVPIWFEQSFFVFFYLGELINKISQECGYDKYSSSHLVPSEYYS